MKRVASYLKETRAEVKKVAWPDREYVTQATIVILIVSFMIGFFVMIVDIGFSRMIMTLNQVF